MQDFLNDIWANMPEVSGKVWLLRRGQNDGWSASRNDALMLSRAEYVFMSDNDVEYTPDFHKRMFDIFAHQPNIGILGVWRHIAHGFLNANRGGVQNEWFRTMDNLPGVGWMLPKKVIEQIGMFAEHGPCMTKGGNGEDVDYCIRVRQAGYLIGVPTDDIASHITGYD
jgi:GT2 family glycosyltransferase